MAISKQNNFVRFYIVREAAGRSYGKNHHDTIEPSEVTSLAYVIGKAAISTADYAMFLGRKLQLGDELTDRTMEVKNGQEIYFIHRGLLDLRPELWVEPFIRYPNRIAGC